MTIKACNTRILIGGVDLSGETNTIGVSIQGRNLEYGVLQDCDVRRLSMPPKAEIEHKGYFSGVADTGIENLLYTYLGSTTGVHVGVVYDTAGTVPFAYVQDVGYNASLSLPAQVGQLLMVNGKWPTLTGSTNQMVRGYQVYGGAVTATGAVTGIDFGAAGTAGGRLFVFVTSITGSASGATIKLQSDTDVAHGTTADEGTATFSAIGCQEVALSGTVNRYQRMNVTSLGGATGFTFYAISCISGRTY
jgi:hypothetical protein